MIQPGDKTISMVWSFSDDMASIPYRIDLKPGAKPRLVCICPGFIYAGKGKTCKHLRSLKEKAKDGTLLTDEHFQVTEFGKEYLKLKTNQ